MGWYTARRFCELIGGELASVDSMEQLEEIKKHLNKFSSKKIYLSGYAKREKWFWLSGKEIKLDLIEDKDYTIPSLNRNFVTLHNGILKNSQFANGFLCELSSKKLSPNLR